METKTKVLRKERNYYMKEEGEYRPDGSDICEVLGDDIYWYVLYFLRDNKLHDLRRLLESIKTDDPEYIKIYLNTLSKLGFAGTIDNKYFITQKGIRFLIDTDFILEKKGETLKEFIKAARHKEFLKDKSTEPLIKKMVLRKARYPQKGEAIEMLSVKSNEKQDIEAISRKSLNFANRFKDARENINKLKKLEERVAISHSKDEVFSYLALFFPRLERESQKLINDMINHLGTWDLESFKKLFRLTIVYFDALKAGLKTGTGGERE